jgi:chorismate mutase
MALRGIRGATTIESNTKEEILENTQELLSKIIQSNQINTQDIASIFFSVTKDLNATFPAIAARNMGLSQTPLLCFNEIDVPGSVPFCIRILMQINSDHPQDFFEHIYLKKAVSLRPDIAS